jgi:hypothetical protein
MRALFWLSMGVTIGVLVTRKLTALASRFTPRGIATTLGEGLAELADAARDFAADVRDAMHEREAQLHETYGNAADHAA